MIGFMYKQGNVFHQNMHNSLLHGKYKDVGQTLTPIAVKVANGCLLAGFCGNRPFPKQLDDQSPLGG